MKVLGRMPRWLVVLVVLALAAAPSVAQVTALPQFTVESVDRAVVLVNVVGESNGRTVRGSGSGVIIDPNGLILTASHVVARANQIDVTLTTGETFAARVLGIDPVFDTALLRVESRRLLPTVALGASSLLQRGDLLMAFGRAPRRQSGPTAGALLDIDLEVRPGVPYLRSSAVVWPGDSGGAVVNERGELVGLIVAITRDGAVSLSVAADAIKGTLANLRTGMVRHPWIGIGGMTVTDQLVQELGLAVRSGVLILEVVEGGPAAQAGLRGGRSVSPRDIPRGGDVITAIDGRPVTSFGALAAYVLSKHIGDALMLEFNRDGQMFTTTVVLAERPGL